MINKNVLVTTDHNNRGVFGGVLLEYDNEKCTARLKDARMCIYWSKDMHGVLGLASSGPSKDCRVSESVPEMSLNFITMVVLMTDEAMGRWEEEPWG